MLAIALATLLVIAGAFAVLRELAAPGPAPLVVGPQAPGPDVRSSVALVVPNPSAGRAGWCGFIRRSGSPAETRDGFACASPIAAGGSLILVGGYRAGGASIEYAVVTARARAVRFSGVPVPTRGNPSLPYGWRYAVASFRRSGPRPWRAMALDAAGRELPPAALDGPDPGQAGSRPVTRARPARRCVIGGAAGYEILAARVAVGVPPVAPRIEGRAFASCATTVFAGPRARSVLTAAILRDAQDPSARADALPRVPDIAGRRLGRGWIAVYGGSAAARRDLLDRLRPRM